MTHTLTRAEACNEIMKSNGTFSGVTFVKKDGSTRNMVARRRVYKGLAGGKNTTRHIPKYVTVYDVHACGFRNINLNTITGLRTGGYEFMVG